VDWRDGLKDGRGQPRNADSQGDTRRAIYSLIAVFVGLLVFLGALGIVLVAVDSDVLDLVLEILSGFLILAGVVRLLMARGRKESVLWGLLAIGTGLLALMSALSNR
jgi:hypothetical protein